MNPCVAVLAHRGSPDRDAGIPENTVGAFVRAGSLGADGVELDVHRTRDGALVVHHDAEVSALGTISDLMAEELPAHVPLLDDSLAACGAMSVNIEVKNLPTEAGFDPDERASRQVATLVSDTGRVGQVIVSSFWLPSLEAARETVPSIRTALLLAGWADAASGLEAARRSGCSAVHLHRSLVTAELVDDAHRAGLAVGVWTVSERLQVIAMAEAGVDTLITDDVPVALAALGRPPSPGSTDRDKTP
jgi:glycerophosphoryl diester phosphodiesterase